MPVTFNYSDKNFPNAFYLARVTKEKKKWAVMSSSASSLSTCTSNHTNHALFSLEI